MKSVTTPQSRCRIGVARADITPPIGIYNRMWGAASQDLATAVHRPLLATALWLQPIDADATQAHLLLTIDHCILDVAEMSRLRHAASSRVAIDPNQVHICLSHTHGAGNLARSCAALPGGDLIIPYLDSLARQMRMAGRHGRRKCQGRCAESLARDPARWRRIGGIGTKIDRAMSADTTHRARPTTRCW